MPKFKLAVSKGQKKYSIVVNAEHEQEAREKVHNEGYSILGVELFQESEVKGKKFYFEVESGGKEKTGSIIGDDIFKIYLKLKSGLGYTVKFLYVEEDKDLPQDQKQKIVQDLEKQFVLYEQRQKKKTKETKDDTQNGEKKDEQFYLQKELEESYRLIDLVLFKLKNLLDDTTEEPINPEQKEKLKNIFNAIIKVKKTTNISKLKQIGELALLKVGSIELQYLEKTKSEETRILLKDTNKLLKQIGSHKQFVEKDRDIGYILRGYFQGFSDFFTKIKQLKESTKIKKQEIDKDSYSYLKTILLLQKYEERLKKNNMELLRGIFYFIFPFGSFADKGDHIKTKRRVIEQNISLLRAKKSGKVFSYTQITKGYIYVVEAVIRSLNAIKEYIFLVFFFYGVFFTLYLNARYYNMVESIGIGFNYAGLFYAIISVFIFLGMYLSRGFLSFLVNIVFLSFIVIF